MTEMVNSPRNLSDGARKKLILVEIVHRSLDSMVLDLPLLVDDRGFQELSQIEAQAGSMNSRLDKHRETNMRDFLIHGKSYLQSLPFNFLLNNAPKKCPS